MSNLSRIAFRVAAAWLIWAATALAQDASPSAPAPSERPLPPLPEVPGLTLEPPSADSLALLDAVLERVVSTDEEERLGAAQEVGTMAAPLVPAVQHRLDKIADQANRGEMKDLLEKLRRDARQKVREEMKATGQKGRIVTPDYLTIAVEHARPDSKTWRDLTQVLAMSRMLGGIGTVESTRVLIHVYVRFEFLRVDTQLQLEKLGDRAVAALVETRRHRAEKIAHWAERQLDMLGKAIPSEAVQTTDLEVLADVLRAYGRIRDPDAAQILISFANTERAQVRDAARQAVALMGDVAKWQLQDAYETVVGKRAPQDWTWQRTARELFAEYDRLRLARVYQLYDEGRTAYAASDLVKMRGAYDKVLARDPMFEHGPQMAAGYLAFARKVVDSDPDAARDALSRARRLCTDESLRRSIESLLLTLEAEALLDGGIVDQELFRRASDLDPANTRARQALVRAERGETEVEIAFQKWIGAAVIGALALAAILVLGLWPRRGVSRARPETAADADATRRGETGVVEATAAQPAPTDAATRADATAHNVSAFPTTEAATNGAPPSPVNAGESTKDTDQS